MGYSKYGNKVCYLGKFVFEKHISIPEGENPLNFLKFDSELERQVYLDLHEWLKDKNLEFNYGNKPFRLELNRQVKIPLINDLKYGIEVNHFVDFSITLYSSNSTGNKVLQTYYIEAKGLPTADAILKWKVMEVKYGYFDKGKYLVVGSNSKKLKQTIPNNWIMSIATCLKSVDKSIDIFIDAYECINGVH